MKNSWTSSHSSTSSSINNTESSDSEDVGVDSMFIGALSSFEGETTWVCARLLEAIGRVLASATETQGTFASAPVPRAVPGNQDTGLEPATRSSPETTGAKSASEAGSAHPSHADGRDTGYANQVGADGLQRRLDFPDGCG